ncbi:MAG TPA: cyclic nucleotide-binding domain-containing protein [Thermomicrobiales bacterium]|jgi:CRP-like cAMP-binding protein
MSASTAIEDVFAAVPLFKRLSARQRSRLARHATTRTYQPGDTIIREGDTGMTLYVILTGAARVTRRSAEGHTVSLHEMGPTGFFGEMGLLDDVVRSATITASAPMECALLGRWDFQRELRDDPAIALALLPILTERIRDLEARLSKAGPPTP